MQKFFLSVWVPSFKRYIKVSELKMYQLEIIAKYILNDDDIALSTALNEILLDNLEDKTHYKELTKFDKWFILTFLRASSIESTVSYIAGEETTTLTFDLFDILTKLSEIELATIKPLTVADTTFYFNPVSDLFVQDYVLKSITRTKTEDIEFLPYEVDANIQHDFYKTIEETIYNEIKAYINVTELQYKGIFIIENVNNIKNFYSVPFKLYDNTLFYFLKSIFKPAAQNLYTKKYILLSKLHIDLASINQLTPFECDIYIGILNSAENSKKTKKASISL